MSRFRIYLLTRTPIRALNLCHIRGNNCRLFTGMFRNTIYRDNIGIHFLGTNRMIRLFGVVMDLHHLIINRLMTIFIMTLMTIVLNQIIKNNRSGTTLNTRLPRHGKRTKNKLRLFVGVCLGTITYRRDDHLFKRRITLSPKIVTSNCKQIIMFNIRVVNRPLNNATCNMRVRAIYANTSRTSRPNNTRLR